MAIRVGKDRGWSPWQKETSRRGSSLFLDLFRFPFHTLLLRAGAIMPRLQNVSLLKKEGFLADNLVMNATARPIDRALRSRHRRWQRPRKLIRLPCPYAATENTGAENGIRRAL